MEQPLAEASKEQFAEAATAFGVASKRPLRTLVTRLPRPLLLHRRLTVRRGLPGGPSCRVGPVTRVTIAPEGTRPLVGELPWASIAGFGDVLVVMALVVWFAHRSERRVS